MRVIATPESHPGAMTEAAPAAHGRLEPVDVLRGIVMILMALDHTRDFFGQTAISPTDLARTTVPLFFTRWITHFCAPVFFLLTGTGAYLSLRRKSKPQLSRYLLLRGLRLILLELTVFRCLALQFNFDYRVTVLNVLWALGWAMIVLSVLVRLPASFSVGFGAVMIVAHNLTDSVRSTSPIWTILHSPGFVWSTPGHSVAIAYPLIPWVGVTALGYGLGQIYAWPAQRRKTFLLRAGAALIAAFAIIRATNIYGDPLRWSAQKSVLFTALSFLNTTKYPPSLLFLLMTLGPALIVLWAVDRRTPGPLGPALTFGRVPMFYFLLHMPLIHLLAVIACFLYYGHVHWMFESPSVAQFPFTPPPGWGFSLPVIYLLWVSVVIALYPLCRWFETVRRRRTPARFAHQLIARATVCYTNVIG